MKLRDKVILKFKTVTVNSPWPCRRAKIVPAGTVATIVSITTDISAAYCELSYLEEGRMSFFSCDMRDLELIAEGG